MFYKQHISYLLPMPPEFEFISILIANKNAISDIPAFCI